MIYLTSDTHREIDIHKINPDEFVEGLKMTREDYLIICGDFGCIWDGADGDRFWLKWINSLPWTTLFIDGNHENFDVLNSYPVVDFHGGKAHQIRDNIYHLMRGHIFDLQGKKFFAFGGGYSHDQKYRTESKNWWKSEFPTKEECQLAVSNLQEAGWKVDYVLTHDIFGEHPFAKKYNVDMEAYHDEVVALHSFLDEIHQKLEYNMWFHGHYHTDGIYDDKGKNVVCLFDKVIELDQFDPNGFPKI